MKEEIKTEINTENNKPNGKLSFFGELYDWVASIFSAVLCFIVIFTAVARVITVDGESMNDTLQHSDRLVISDIGYTPQYGDIVIFHADKLYDRYTKSYGKTLVKRIIGLPGDKIRIDFKEGVVYRNGVALDEPFTSSPTIRSEGFPDNVDVEIEAGKVFLMGDNRNNSTDSRSEVIGQVDMRYIMGKAYLRIWPFNALGTV